MYLPRAMSAAVGWAADAGAETAASQPAKIPTNAHRMDLFTGRYLRRWPGSRPRATDAEPTLHNESAHLLVPAFGPEPGFHHQRVLARVEVVALAAADHAKPKALVQGERLDIG